MFEYDPKDAETAWLEGQYPATFLGALDTTSKSTNQPMQVWTFEVYDDANGRKQVIKDYVTKAALFKVRMLASALNRADEFKAGKFMPEDHIGSMVAVKLIVEQQDGYDDKNKIDRISANPGTAKPSPAKTAKAETVPQIKEDDIPFD